jgi:hypothetical protein
LNLFAKIVIFFWRGEPEETALFAGVFEGVAEICGANGW